MSTPVTERVDEWTERPFSGGYRELQDLADSAFSGVVRADGAELFMTKGTVVGILRGSIEDFEDGSGTVYDAPTDALPLLAVMQERSDEVRAKYYSEETSLSEVDQTLEDGKFTGYVELSENVLSGDYYLVYHQGRSMSVAFVGNAEQLLTDDEAFQRANDEVGIFEVRPVTIEAVEIPEPPEPDPEPDDTDPMAAGAIDDDPEAADTETPSDPTPAEAAETVVDSDTAADTADSSAQSVDESVGPVDDGPVTPADDEPAVDTESAVTEPSSAAGTDPNERELSVDGDAHSTETDTGEPEPVADQSETAADHRPASPEPGRDGDSDAVEKTSGDGRNGQTETSEAETSSATDASTHSETIGATAEQTATQSTSEQTASPRSDPVRDGTEPEPSTETQQNVPPTPTTETVGDGESMPDDPSSLETRAIPSLDPEQTSTRSRSNEPRRDAPGRDSNSGTSGAPAQAAEQLETEERDGESTNNQESASDRDGQSTDRQGNSRAASQESAATESAADAEPAQPKQEAVDETAPEPDESDDERISELQDLLTEREKEIKRLEADLETAETERESVRRELEQVRAERDELENQVEKLERDLQQLEEELGAATDAQQRMTPQEALSGTDIFVRYRSKGDATLEKAHQGGGIKKDFSDNLRLEKHTQFDADVSAVGGREYGEFLEDTVAYKFVRWVVEDLLFEIQSTGHTETLSDLYDALPKINRVELNGAVTVTVSEDGQETESTETFDVVFRERMGDPLLVANINDSRQGASESMMEGLITAAERVGQTSDQFASAFLVTESFFEPEALETVAEATRGGILSRDKRKSFVNLSRKRGYHLCLVEARNQNFHLEVPEL